MAATWLFCCSLLRSPYRPSRHFAAPQQQRRSRSKADCGTVGRVAAKIERQHLALRMSRNGVCKVSANLSASSR